MKNVPLVPNKGFGPTQLKDINVSSEFSKRIKSGLPIIDKLFGGEFPGILQKTVTMITGSPGAGKTTFVLQLADALTNNANVSLLYNSCEEMQEMIKMSADRLNLSSSFYIDSIMDIDEFIATAKAMEVDFVIQDSLQKLSDGNLFGRRLIVSVCNKLIRFAQETNTTVIFTGQVTKSGSAAGPLQLVHDVDAHCHMSVDKVTGVRQLCFEKNRMGPSYMPLELTMGVDGLSFKEVQSIQSVDNSSKKHMFAQIARNALLSGDALSGYCHERLGLECSGNSWRGIVGQVVAELKRDGYDVKEEKIRNRTHYFIESIFNEVPIA